MVGIGEMVLYNTNGSLIHNQKEMSKMTRRITLNPRIGNQSTLDWNYDWIVVKDGTEVKEFKGKRNNEWNYSYSAEQLKIISEVTSVLEQNNQPPMTEDEIEYLLYPFGREEKINTDDLQHLAGFRVEKTISSI
jgi:hypothetical protein